MKNREFKEKKKKTGKVSRVLLFLLNAFLTVMLVGIITLIIVGSAFAIYVKNNVDINVDETKFELNTTNTTTKLYYYEFTDRENRIGNAVEIEDARLYGGSNSIFVPYSQIPKDLINAFVAIEDERFWDHKGVDWYRTIGAGVNFIIPIKDKFGASTITQQLIKNVTGENDYKIQRKIQEIFWALDLESKKSKEDILTLYLNVINLSQNCYGVQAAANTYFGKDVSELTLLECACIAAITNNPSYYNPIRFPEHNKERRQTILWKMCEENLISEEQMNENYDAEPVFNLTSTDDSTNNINSWYTDMVINDVIDDLVELGYTSQAANLLVYSGGLNIYTCMDPEVQAVLDEVYLNEEYFPEHTSGMPAQSSMIIIHPTTGDILGVAGAKGEKKGNRIQNFATDTVRPAGSSIKPVSVYGPALEMGLINYATVYDDTPVKFRENNSPWPHNLPDVYNGLTNINSAVERSVNTVAIKVLEDLSPQVSFDFCRNKLGMESLLELVELSNGGTLTDIDLAPLALGQLTYGCTVREITAAYTAFANKGIFNYAKSYIKVTNAEGDVILSNEEPGNIVFSEENAVVMTKMLSNVVSNGTAKAITLRKTVDCAGKTGTTNNDYDRWYIGYTPYYIGGVWYGYEYPKTLSNLKSNPCVSIWDTVMTKLHQPMVDDASNGGEELKRFDESGNVITATYCKDSGLLMTDACRADPRGNRAETGYFAVGTQPNSYCTTHVMVEYCTETGAVASGCCPSDGIKLVGLIAVDNRSFPKQMTITDAQYVYRFLPENVEPGGWWGDPYFINAIPSGTFVGSSNAETQYNQFCWKHFDFYAFNRGEIDSHGNRNY